VSDLTEQLIAEEEGRLPYAYQDSRGLWTIGIGCLVDHSVAGAGLCDAAIDAQFAHDSALAVKEATALAGFDACNDVQRAVLVSMCFQLGNLAEWPKFKAALAAGDFKGAAAEGLNSMWARQTPKRAQREMAMLESGQWQEQ
jgi:lysozyme